MAGYGLGASLLGSVPAAMVGDVSPTRSGRVVAVFQMSADLGAIIGSLVAGWLTDTVSFQAAFAVSALVAAAGVPAALALPRRGRLEDPRRPRTSQLTPR
jgi:MFS family permease